MRAKWLAVWLALSATACGGSDEPYSDFRAMVDAGASCQQLFEFRSVLDPKASVISNINRDLRAVGCRSASSVRVDATVTPDSANREQTAAGANRQSFTVSEYRVYRTILDTPMSVPEPQSLEAAAKHHQLSVAGVKQIADRVQRALFTNNWYGSPEAEIRHASDWKGEPR